jgi:hypothetical protein
MIFNAMDARRQYESWRNAVWSQLERGVSSARVGAAPITEDEICDRK